MKAARKGWRALLRPGDWLVIGLVLALAAGVAAAFYLPAGGSGRLTCEIVQDGVLVRSIPLTADTREEITIEGAVTNVIEIEGECVRVARSDCPDQVCVRTGDLTRAGQTAVCLPNRLIVRLTGDAPAVDAVVS